MSFNKLQLFYLLVRMLIIWETPEVVPRGWWRHCFRQDEIREFDSFVANKLIIK